MSQTPALLPVGPPAGAGERRRLARHDCLLAPVRFVTRPSFRCAEAFVCDWSAEGVGLLLPDLLEPGALLLLELRPPGRRCCLQRLARVVHAGPLADGTCRAGCHFARPLDGGELARLRRELGAAEP